MKMLLRSSLFAIALFGSYAAFSSTTSAYGPFTPLPRPNCSCLPPAAK